MTDPMRPRALSAGAAGVAGWLTIAIGTLHLAVGIASYSDMGLDFLWFQGSGIAVLLIGAVTLVARRVSHDVVIRRVAAAANVLGVALGVAFCVLTDWREPQGMLLILLFGIGAVACLSYPGVTREGPS